MKAQPIYLSTVRVYRREGLKVIMTTSVCGTNSSFSDWLHMMGDWMVYFNDLKVGLAPLHMILACLGQFYDTKVGFNDVIR